MVEKATRLRRRQFRNHTQDIRRRLAGRADRQTGFGKRR